MVVLITGSSGYLGNLLAKKLADSHCRVIGVDIRSNPENFPEGQFRHYYCSITDRERLIDIFFVEKPDVVVHFACSFNKVRNRDKEYQIDVVGSSNVLIASNRTPEVRQLIFSSSAAAYGGNIDNQLWLKESDPLRPGKYRYGMNKNLIEKIFHGSEVRDDLHVISLRICSVVGPTYRKNGSIINLIRDFPYMPVFCLSNKMQFLHSDDMLALFDCILSDKSIQGTFNLASDSFVQVRNLCPDKKFVPIPLLFVKGILWILWNLKLLNLQPAGIKDAVYPIILDPTALASRYKYAFRHTSMEAYRSIPAFK